MSASGGRSARGDLGCAHGRGGPDPGQAGGSDPLKPTDLILIRDHGPWTLRAATQVGRRISLSASGRDDP